MIDDTIAIACCGMSRSGSTLQYQIVCDLVAHLGFEPCGFPMHWNKKDKVVLKCEIYEPAIGDLIDLGKIAAVSIHRDPRQVALSLMHFYTARAEYQDTDLPKFNSNTRQWLPQAIDWHNRWTEHDVPSTRYEDNSFPGRLAYWCADRLGLTDDPDIDCVSISYKYLTNHQQRRIDLQTEWLDRETMLTRGHLSATKGRENWQDRLTLSKIEFIQSLPGVLDFLHKWHYPVVKVE